MKNISKITFLICSLVLSNLVLATDAIDPPEKVELEFDINALKTLSMDVIACSRPLPFPLDESGEPVEGWVKIELLIGIDGRPIESRILERSGGVELEKAALNTAKWQKFPDEIGNLITREYTWKIEEEFRD